MMNLLYTNQENKEEKKQLSLSKSQLSQQSPLISILPTTNLELGISTTTYITTTTIKNHIENVSFLCKLCFVLSCYV